MKKTPYSELPDVQFHRKTIVGKHPSRFDPITNPKFVLDNNVKIMTMGSCFAQHLSKWLVEHGFNLLLKETDINNAGGMFSANYGNVYTVQQAVQLFDRAMGHWSANDEVYSDENDRHFDPLRPSSIINGFGTKNDAIVSRESHQQVVKSLFLEAEVLVFTLGLTEAWVRINDGATLPIAPGVVAGIYNEKEYQFHNYSYQEVVSSLDSFCKKVHDVNPKCKILLTVSPVPLAATYENKHISVSSLASKAILRAAVEEVLNKFEFVDYFPSFEVFYTPGIGHSYFDYDSRHVLPSGVSHAMRLFEKHYTNFNSNEVNQASLEAYSKDILKNYHNVICDEGKIR